MTNLIDRDAALTTIQQQLALWESGTLVCGLDDLLRLYLPQAIAALPAVKVGVKPLVWTTAKTMRVHDHFADDYIIRGDENCLVERAGIIVAARLSLDAAKAAAQADYEARHQAAQVGVTQPAPDAAAIREAALREAAKEAEYFASKDLELRLTRPDGTPVQRLTTEQAMREIRHVAQHISQRILALTEKPHDRAALKGANHE